VVFIGYKPTTDWEYYSDLLGGDWNMNVLLSIQLGIIIPTDFHIFQRG
jgi:hypothetical protein